MPPLPKRKLSRARKGFRRAHAQLDIPHLVPCPHCRTPKLSHHVCPNCGRYKGREVVVVQREESAQI